MTSISVSPVAVSGLQVWLTRQWLKAEAWMDKREPETPQVLANFERIWQGMVRFEAVERSLRRTGYESCIAPDRGCSEQVISCHSCAVDAPETHDKPLVVSTTTGRARDGSLWQIETLNF